MAGAMLRELFDQPTMNDFPGPFACRAKVAVDELRGSWERTCRAAAMNRRLGELHATRTEYESLLKGHLQLLKHYFALTKLHQEAFGPNQVWIDNLSLAVAELQQLYDSLFPRWQTAEDLNQILIQKFTLPFERLQQLAVSHPPPQSWFDETADPFSDD